jgi:hypothetical protein
MVWMWLALLFLAVGWLGVVPVYSLPRWSAAIYFVMAFALFALAFRRTDVTSAPKAYIGLLLPFGLFGVLIPWPYNLGAFLMAASLIIAMSSERSALLRRGAIALAACGGAVLLQSAAQPLLFKLFARYHGAAWPAQLVGLILETVGARVSVNGSMMHMQTFEQLVPANITWESSGYYTIANFAIAGMALLFTLRAKPVRWLAFLAICFAYPVIRYPIVFLAYQESGRTDLFWTSWVTLLTLLPLPLLIARFVTKGLGVPECVGLPPLHLKRSAVKVLLASGAAAVCIIGLFSFQDPGARKHGRVLIDEAHSNWEWTTRRYDTEWYSQASGYNYYCMADFLGHFYHVDRGMEMITPALLTHYDVLVLKTLTKPLQPTEIDAIVEFVHSGGGLWLIGDHTNVFGISSHMDPLARHFGMAFKYDATYDLQTGGLTIYRRSVMLPHPTVQHMPPVFLFGTSCSMDAGLGADYPIIGYGVRALRADYSRENFFPENKLTLDQEFGLLLQQAAVRFGRGRVVAFTDSTVFSNFWFYMPGKSELCLGTVEWLNRTNRWTFVRWLLGIAFLCALLLVIRWSHGTKSSTVLVWVLAGVLLGVPVGMRTFAAMGDAAYPVPTPRQPLPRIAFEREHCNYTLPSEALNPSMALENHYHTFFTWTQRLGYMPASIPSLSDALAAAKVVVLVNPDEDFSTEELLRMTRYLKAGGRILVLDGAHNFRSTANQFLAPFGMSIEQTPLVQSFVFDRGGRKVAAVEHPRPITGGTPVLTLAFGKSFVAATTMGKGVMAVVGSSGLFTDRTMGVTSTVPSSYQRGIYEIEFWLFRNLMEGAPDPRLWDLPHPVWEDSQPGFQTSKQPISGRP